MKTLDRLISSLENFQVQGKTTVEVLSLVDYSKKVDEGSLFVAISGTRFDAHSFIPEAIKKGAVAVVGEKAFDKKLGNITYVRVKNSRKALALLASSWYENPSNKLKVIGVTGTDGKTTTSNLIYWIIKTSGRKVGIISTLGAKIDGSIIDTGLHVTNPEPIALQGFLSQMVAKKCEFAVMEVTSHGLDQDRVGGVSFYISVLINISHEHLDYHKTFENYVKTKAKLFNLSQIAVLNQKDSSFNLIKKFINSDKEIILYPQEKTDISIERAIEDRFPEPYNRLNALAAATVARRLRINNDAITRAIRSFPQLSGRLEKIKNDKDLEIIVDFAHTPNALENVLMTLNKRKKGRLIVVFGCAGGRDMQKRPMMAKISTQIADISVFTAEDPRHESIEEILNQMVEGVKKGANAYFELPQRGEAIFYAIQKLARKGDTVVICGKGHEKSMAYGAKEYPWSDQEAVREALKGKVKRIAIQ